MGILRPAPSLTLTERPSVYPNQSAVAIRNQLEPSLSPKAGVFISVGIMFSQFLASCYNPVDMSKFRSSKQLQLWLGIFITLASFVLIYYFLKRENVKLDDILEEFRTAHYGYLALSAVSVLLFMVFRAVRWRFMLNNSIPWSKVFHIQNIGYMLTMVLPFRIGDVARAILIGRTPPVTLPQGLSTMVVERVLDLLFIVTLLPFTLSSAGTLPDNIQAAVRLSGILAITAIIVLVVAANQRPLANRLIRFVLERVPFLDTETWSKRADDILAGLSSLTRLRDGVILLVLSIVVWLPILFAYYAGMRAVHLEPTWAIAGFTVCAAALSLTVPSSPGQLGVFHAGVIFALTEILGQPEAASTGFAFLYHALNLLLMIVLGFIGILGLALRLGDVIASTQTYSEAKTG